MPKDKKITFFTHQFFRFTKRYFGCCVIMVFIFQVSSAQALEPVINEIGWMGTDHSSYDEWIELYNPSQNNIDLTGWKLKTDDNSPNISLQGTIKSDDFFVLERTDDTTLPRTADQIYTGNLNNTGEIIQLLNTHGQIIDQTPKNIWPGGDNTKPKKSLERINAFSGSGTDPNNWSTTTADTSNITDASNNTILGTPGSYNSISPPKPQLIKKFEPENFSLSVLKVAPATLGQTKEWLSLHIQSNHAVDLTDWSIRRGNTSKKISTLGTQLHLNETHFPHRNISGKTLDYIEYPPEKFILLPQKNSATIDWKYEGIIWFSPSPISLPDSGGEIEILNGQNEIVSRFAYPKTKKGSRLGQKYAEIWHQDPSSEIFPLLHWESVDITTVQKNFIEQRPTLPENLNIKISEISLNGGTDQDDFIELYVSQTPVEGANIRDLQVTQNGTEILRIKKDHIVQDGDFIIIKFGNKPLQIDRNEQIHVFTGTGKKSLADSNGTLTVKLWAGTSWEEIEDFWCWKKPNISASNAMLGRIKKSGYTQNHCFGIAESNIEKMSWAQNFLNPSQSPISKGEAIKKHYLGSPGQTNYWPNPINSRPQAVIRLQSTTDFSINLTGEDSYDANGDFDIKSVQWTLFTKDKQSESEEIIAYKMNPNTFYIESIKKFTTEQCELTKLNLELKIYDYHHTVSRKKLSLPLHWDQDTCTLKPPKPQKRPKMSKIFLTETKEIPLKADFFSDVMPVIKSVYNSKIQQPASVDQNIFDLDVDGSEEPRELITARDKFFAAYPQITPELLSKNIGWAVYGGR
jgi:hypothetical protein